MVCGRSDVIFFFNDTATTEIYTLSLHDALPIFLAELGDLRVDGQRGLLGGAGGSGEREGRCESERGGDLEHGAQSRRDRKSTRLNSSHANISYAVFCLKKKKTTIVNPFACYLVS